MKKLAMITCCIIIMSMIGACTKKDTSVEKTAQPVEELRTCLFLSQAQFIEKVGKVAPGPARLEIIYEKDGQWTRDLLEDEESNVFHKTMSAGKIGFPEGFLTIGANNAHLKLWQKSGKGWAATELWNPVFGGKHNRLRDFEIGDVNGDGTAEIIIATHDQGIIAILEGSGKEWKVNEFNRKERTFVHEVEIGDVDGDGINEVYTTPSAPNKMDGTVQPGQIARIFYKDGKYTFDYVEEFPDRHVKEILVAQFNDEGQTLLAALEAETTKGDDGKEVIVDPVKIKQYHYVDGVYKGEIIGELDDRQCRFLNYSDINGDGNVDLIASGYKSGLWYFESTQKDEETGFWKQTLIDGNSSGYEHATLLADLDGDGKDEIYVAADDQRQLNRYIWNGTSFDKTTLININDSVITFGLMNGKVRL